MKDKQHYLKIDLLLEEVEIVFTFDAMKADQKYYYIQNQLYDDNIKFFLASIRRNDLIKEGKIGEIAKGGHSFFMQGIGDWFDIAELIDMRGFLRNEVFNLLAKTDQKVRFGKLNHEKSKNEATSHSMMLNHARPASSMSL